MLTTKQKQMTTKHNKQLFSIDYKCMTLICAFDCCNRPKRLDYCLVRQLANMGNSKGQRHIKDPVGKTNFSGRDCSVLIRLTNVFTK